MPLSEDTPFTSRVALTNIRTPAPPLPFSQAITKVGIGHVLLADRLASRFSWPAALMVMGGWGSLFWGLATQRVDVATLNVLLNIVAAIIKSFTPYGLLPLEVVLFVVSVGMALADVVNYGLLGLPVPERKDKPWKEVPVFMEVRGGSGGEVC
jgi:hypothetical protein